MYFGKIRYHRLCHRVGRACLWILIFPRDAIKIFRALVKAVVGKFLFQVQCNQEYTGDPQCKTAHIDDSVELVLVEVPESCLKIVAEHLAELVLTLFLVLLSDYSLPRERREGLPCSKLTRARQILSPGQP